MTQLDASAIEKIQDLTLASHTLEALKFTACPSVALPENVSIRNLEKYNENRFRFRGEMVTTSIADFVKYSIQNAIDIGVSCFINAENMKAVTIFNIGNPTKPGHADHKAILSLKKTAPFKALLNINGDKNRQKELAEWLEDWKDYLTAFDADGNAMDIKKAVAAVRSITIESLSSAEHEDNDFGAKRSIMQSVEAKSKNIMPAAFEFKCVPYEGLNERRFSLRYSVLTGADVPVLVLRIIQLEAQEEAMANEFRDLLICYFEDQPIDTFIGQFEA